MRLDGAAACLDIMLISLSRLALCNSLREVFLIYDYLYMSLVPHIIAVNTTEK